MSNQYSADESVESWMRQALLEEYEAQGLWDDRVEWLRRFQTEVDGIWLWKNNDNNEWGLAWREWVEDRLDEIFGYMPSTLRKAILNDLVNDWSCRMYDERYTTLENDIMSLAEEDGIVMEQEQLCSAEPTERES